jgi:CBS-domain-containing membrane protein
MLLRGTATRILKNLRSRWRNYVWQSLCATLAVLVVLAVLDLRQAVIISSIGATAFIVFMKPRNPFAAPRNVIGGHLVGLTCGALCALIPHRSPPVALLLYALAVGLSLFTMVVTDTEHPPAAGTALSVVTLGPNWETIVALLISVVLLVLIQRLLRRYLIDL